MTFKDIENNDLMIKRLTTAVINGHISHAYIFEADSCVDKLSLANSFAKAVLCRTNVGHGCDSCVVCKRIDHRNHADIIYVEKDGASTKDEAIEELQEKLKKKPYTGDRNIAVIEDADTMTARAQNRLLKTLEEPFLGTVLILLSENISALAETIRSRCVALRWNRTTREAFGELFPEAESLVETILKGAPFYQVKSKILSLAEGRDEAYKLLDVMETVCGAYIKQTPISNVDMGRMIWCVEEARGDIMRGMNVGYTLKNMILKMEERRW